MDGRVKPGHDMMRLMVLDSLHTAAAAALFAASAGSWLMTGSLPARARLYLRFAAVLLAAIAVSVPLAALSDAGWAIAAGAGRTFFLRRANAKWLGWVSGMALIGGGIWLSLARRPG